MLLAIAVASNVAVLFVAKYLSLSIGIANALFGAGLNDPAFPLPIGVSFFTFQSLSYVIDVGSVKNLAHFSATPYSESA